MDKAQLKSFTMALSFELTRLYYLLQLNFTQSQKNAKCIVFANQKNRIIDVILSCTPYISCLSETEAYNLKRILDCITNLTITPDTDIFCLNETVHNLSEEVINWSKVLHVTTPKPYVREDRRYRFCSDE